MEVSRATEFLIDQKATVTAELTSDHYRRSPLIQGGAEIPCRVTSKCIHLVQELHKELKGKEILGYFVHAGVNDLTILSIVPAPKIRKKPEVQMKDIRIFFIRNQTERGKPDQTLHEEKVTNETVIIVN